MSSGLLSEKQQSVCIIKSYLCKDTNMSGMSVDMCVHQGILKGHMSYCALALFRVGKTSFLYQMLLLCLLFKQNKYVLLL